MGKESIDHFTKCRKYGTKQKCFLSSETKRFRVAVECCLDWIKELNGERTKILWALGLPERALAFLSMRWSFRTLSKMISEPFFHCFSSWFQVLKIHIVFC